MGRFSLVIFAVAGLLAAGVAWGAGSLTGSVGPGFEIALLKSDGSPARTLEPGDYAIAVTDDSDGHSFHFRGPGADAGTGVEFVGTRTLNVTLQNNAAYTFFCDIHPTSMKGTVTVGTPPATTAPPPPLPKLLATAGPGARLTLRNEDGVAVKSVNGGTYSVSVRDASRTAGFFLTGPGVSRRTTAAFTGTKAWKVTFQTGKTYRYGTTGKPAVSRALRAT